MPKKSLITEVDLKENDKFEFVHISDLHFNRDMALEAEDYYDTRIVNDPRATTRCKTLSGDLIESLGEYNSVNDDKLKPDAVVVSGDLVHRGI
ncbi:metallophosphoesterase [Candidatus Magnetominusculus xianensis]|nr:metallophosphoesterase [Candidatus Magnetominusculus xianensis]MBF0404417.1 metallophosphoesterase [Nitrospirota bacterium]